MNKLEKEYKENYSDIPKDDISRLEYMITKMNICNLRGKVEEGLNRIMNMKWNRIDYTIYLVPKATPRPRATRTGVFYVKGASDNKKLFNHFYKEELTIYTPCKFYCRSYFPIPKSMNKAEKLLAELGWIRPVSKPDFDNLAKTYSDMIQGSLLYDDQLIIEGSSSKYYSIKPRIEITIEYMDDFDCEFNKRKSKMGM